MLETISQGMVLAGLILMIYNAISIARFVRHQHDILTGEGVAGLGYAVFVFTVCFTAVYAIIFLQNFAELTIGLILLGGSAFVTAVLQWIIRLARAIKANTRSLAEALSSVIDARDRDLRGHSRHVELISCLIYDALPEHEREKLNRTNLEYAAIFHDLGKLGVPEAILNKPGRLGADEWKAIRKHPRIGADILRPIRSFEGIID